jgi:protein gp37
LLQTPAAVRFVSLEPLLGPVDLDRIPATHFDTGLSKEECRGVFLTALCGGARTDSPWHLNWVIAGGESGPRARPCNVEWIRSVVDQCHVANVPVFVKQLGSHAVESPSEAGDGPEDVSPDHDPNDPECFRMRLTGKGDVLSEWPEDLRVREYPEVSP